MKTNNHILFMYQMKKNENHMNLLLISENNNQHYVLIKDFNKFMFNQTKHEHKKHFCYYCLQHFTSEDILNKHKTDCIIINGKQSIQMPYKNTFIKFENFHKQLPVPFVIYADFEAITMKTGSCQKNPNKSYIEEYQKHIDCGYGYQVVGCYDDKYTKQLEIYRGEKAVSKFMDKMLEELDWCKNTMKNNFNKPLNMTNEDEENFNKAKECHICYKKI